MNCRLACVLPHILCNTSLFIQHPVWFGREEGYHGTTHEEAEIFCRTIGNMHLCPVVSRCLLNCTPQAISFSLNNKIICDIRRPTALMALGTARYYFYKKMPLRVNSGHLYHQPLIALDITGYQLVLSILVQHSMSKG